MDIQFTKLNYSLSGELKITGSKSESNRLLILQAQYPSLKIKNISNSEDTKQIINALKSYDKVIDIHHAGTAMRFLSAYFAFKNGSEVLLTGSKRMKERPIKILVKALKDLGASIYYQNSEGFPPILIKGLESSGNYVKLSSSISSQYISALMLIAPRFSNGLNIELTGQTTSLPYIEMTKSLLKKIDIEVECKDQNIFISEKKEDITKTITVESDWSSASYFFSMVALSSNANLILKSFKNKSLQGDSCLIPIFNKLGVSSKIFENKITLTKQMSFDRPESITLNLINSPDIAQTIAVTCFGLGVNCNLYGLHTLKIKETDRLSALKKELTKFGAKITISSNSIHMISSKKPNKNIKVSTYQDHRMAMAFTPLALKTSLIIENADVVNKSYPDFWKDIKKIGFEHNII